METEFTSGHRICAVNSVEQGKSKRKHCSIFEVPSNLFDSCRLVELPQLATAITTAESSVEEEEAVKENYACCSARWTCNTCKSSFESLHDQRSHFKSDFHRFNVKLSVAGKDTVKEDDFDEWSSGSLVKDYDISSISGSEDEDDGEFGLLNVLNKESLRNTKKKIFVKLPNGEMISFWKCLLLDDSEKILFENDMCGFIKDDDMHFLTEREAIEKLHHVIHEPRDKTRFRVMLLSSGGHFSGCVFDGNFVVAHKTFHRYVIRAKAGKRQSSKDAGGKIAHSAGASIRRHNELSLKKDIQELLAAWKPYFDASVCIFIHAPSHNHQLLFNGENPHFSCQKSTVRRIPLSVRRPTFKEARRLYNILTQIWTEPDEVIVPIIKQDSKSTISKEKLTINLDNKGISESVLVETREITRSLMPLHEAAKTGNAAKVWELLEAGLDPCVTDESGRLPYMLATRKEVRNTFRRFMALNLDKWDWGAAKVPSPLTKEIEESQNAKQVEKEAKRKARAKELKKLRKAREKKAQEDARQNHQRTRRSPGRVAGVLVLIIGSLMVVAFGQMSRGRTKKNTR